MTTKIVTVGSKAGLHARPAAMLAEAAGAQPIEVTIAKADSPADSFDSSSILGLMGLGAEYGDHVILSAEGAGAETALEELSRVIAEEQDT